jgi:hypothetical protein
MKALDSNEGDESELVMSSLHERQTTPNLRHQYHYFDEFVTSDDNWNLNQEYDAVLYHYMVYRFYHTIQNAAALNEKNDYTLKYFPNVLKELTKRDLDLIITLPGNIDPFPLADAQWTDYDMVYASRANKGSLFPSLDLKGIK